MFVYGFSGPYDWIVVLAIAVALASLIAWGVWRAVQALGRRFALARRTQFAICGTLVCTVCATVVVLRIDRLDAMEQICQTEILKQDRLSGVSDFEITKHVNFWDNHVSGYWGISKPHEEAKVFLWIQYVKDERKHQGFLTCRYSRIPDSGDPPRVQFERVEPWSPNVLSEQNSWVPAERPRRP
jgi:hypothetical protein